MPRVRHGLLAAIDRAALITDVFGGAALARRLADPAVVLGIRQDGEPPDPVRPQARRGGLQGGRLEEARRRLGRARHEEAVRHGAHLARRRDEPDGDGRRRGGRRRTGARSGSRRRSSACRRPSSSRTGCVRATSRRPRSTSTSGSTRTSIRCSARPRSSKGGSNITGIQDVALDRDLDQGPRAGHARGPQAAFKKLQARLVDKNYLLPIVFRERARRARRPGPGTGRPGARRPQ